MSCYNTFYDSCNNEDFKFDASLCCCKKLTRTDEIMSQCTQQVSVLSPLVGDTLHFENYNLTNESIGTGTSILGSSTGPDGNTRSFHSLLGVGPITTSIDNNNLKIEYDSPSIQLLTQTPQSIPTGVWTRINTGTLGFGSVSPNYGFTYPGLYGTFSFTTSFADTKKSLVTASVSFDQSVSGVRGIRIGTSTGVNPFVYSAVNIQPSHPMSITHVTTSSIFYPMDTNFVVEVYQNSGISLNVGITDPNYSTSSVNLVMI